MNEAKKRTLAEGKRHNYFNLAVAALGATIAISLALWVSAAAVVMTMIFMVLTRTIHPPAGANPLFMGHNHAGFPVLLKPVGAGVLVLFVVAALWSRVRAGEKYPSRWW